MTEQTLEQELMFFGTTLNKHPDTRSLFKRAASEIARLAALQAPITCLECRRVIQRSDDWFRCFDCRSNLCEMCTQKHFGATYSRHHESMEQYKREVDILKSRIADLERNARTPGTLHAAKVIADFLLEDDSAYEPYPDAASASAKGILSALQAAGFKLIHTSPNGTPAATDAKECGE